MSDELSELAPPPSPVRDRSTMSIRLEMSVAGPGGRNTRYKQGIEYSLYPTPSEQGHRGLRTLRDTFKQFARTGDWTMNHVHFLDFGPKLDEQYATGMPSLRFIAEQMIAQTMQGELHLEHGRLAMVFKDMGTPNHAAVVLQQTDIIGQETSVRIKGIPPWPKEAEEKLNTERFIAMVLHTHPLDYPPSPQDMRGLFLDPKEDTVTSEMATVVVTPKRLWMVFRGKHTPQGRDISDKVFKEWMGLAESDGLQHTSLMLQGRGDIHSANSYLQTKLLFDMARKYDLQVFTCALGEGFLDKLNRREQRELLTQYQPLALPEPKKD